ncbi:hypothetical protein [Micromonospora pisi]|uniref:hypothetical protein n=1 Tax=Micromonospora pisi TaxID=589240 RepID=UPI000EB49A87|nr:hypothetical protein [Micromonospora pisi]
MDVDDTVDVDDATELARVSLETVPGTVALAGPFKAELTGAGTRPDCAAGLLTGCGPPDPEVDGVPPLLLTGAGPVAADVPELPPAGGVARAAEPPEDDGAPGDAGGVRTVEGVGTVGVSGPVEGPERFGVVRTIGVGPVVPSAGLIDEGAPPPDVGVGRLSAGGSDPVLEIVEGAVPVVAPATLPGTPGPGTPGPGEFGGRPGRDGG